MAMPAPLPGFGQRRAQVRRLEGRFDLLVVGGGIYGAWTAYDAAQRGMRVALVEAEDWGAGTSSASSKLIHGGLRYLEYGHVGLVRTALRERARLLRLAPHRVHALRFLLPLWEDARRSPLALAAGLTLYDLLAGELTGPLRHRRHAAAALAHRCPALARAGLRGGFSYADAAEDDARLVVEIVAAAHLAGAVVLNHCRAVTITGAERVDGAEVVDTIGGASARVLASATVICAGPWTPLLAQQAGVPVRTRRTKGVHLVLPPLPPPMDPRTAMLLTAPADGRVFFLIPWYGATLLGTTDTDWDGDPATVSASGEDARYLLTALQARLPGLGWTARHVRAAFAGVRTLQHQDAVSASAVNREWTLAHPRPGLWLPLGGKYTSARADAARIVDEVQRDRGLSVSCRTGRRALPWAPGEPLDWWLARQQAAAMAVGVDAEAAAALPLRQGTRVEAVLARLREEPGLRERIHPGAPFVLAEAVQAVADEQACTLADVLRRRVPAATLASLPRATVAAVAARLAPHLGWDAAATASATDAFTAQAQAQWQAPTLDA